MMLPSHLLAVLVVCGLLALVRPMPRREWLLAIAFGVAIDLDHLLQLPAYLAAEGPGALTPAAMLHWGAAWQGIMHTPVALVLVAGASFVFISWIPLAAWSLHMVQDFVIARHFVHFGGGVEWFLDLGLLAAFLALAVHDHRTRGALRPMRHHWRERIAHILGRDKGAEPAAP